MKSLLTKSNNIPTYIVPGDNEWNDQINHKECWSYWSKHLLALDSEFKQSWTTSRQKTRPENFGFTHKGILFIGLNLPGGKVHNTDEWSLRHNQNILWVKELLDLYNSEIRGAVLFFHAALSKKHASFTTQVVPILKSFQKPVLIVHADLHKWIYQEAFMAPNITRIQTDKIGPNVPPVQISVMSTGEKIFKYNRRLSPSEGFRVAD